MDYGPNLHNIYMLSTYSLWNETQWFRHKKYLRHADALFRLISFLLSNLKLKVLTLPVPTGTQKQSIMITAAPLPVLTMEKWPLNTQWIKKALQFQENYFSSKDVNSIQQSLFSEISTFLCFLPGKSIAWPETEGF